MTALYRIDSPTPNIDQVVRISDGKIMRTFKNVNADIVIDYVKKLLADKHLIYL